MVIFSSKSPFWTKNAFDGLILMIIFWGNFRTDFGLFLMKNHHFLKNILYDIFETISISFGNRPIYNTRFEKTDLRIEIFPFWQTMKVYPKIYLTFWPTNVFILKTLFQERLRIEACSHEMTSENYQKNIPVVPRWRHYRMLWRHFESVSLEFFQRFVYPK